MTLWLVLLMVSKGKLVPAEVVSTSTSLGEGTESVSTANSDTEIDIATTTVTVSDATSTGISVDGMSATSTASSTVSPLLQNGFVPNPVLEVLYTFDGEEWISLGKVSAEDLSYNSFEIPVDPRATWDDISNIQIKIKSLVIPDVKPDIYVDGMVLEVEYDKKDPNQPGDKSDPKRYQMVVNQVVGSTTVSVVDDPDQGNVLMVGIENGGMLLIYNDTTNGIVFISGLGSDPLPIPAYNFDPGSFTILVTDRKDSCEGVSKETCLEDARGAATFIIRPTAQTPLKYIHTQ
jgi:hypothetical protein